MDNNLLSIIIPVYNVEPYLERCIKSVVNQTYKNIEIILVDDGSTDKSPKILDDWKKKDARIKVIHKENGGVSSARNAALDNMSPNSKYVGFVDSDDFINERMYEILMSKALSANYDIVKCRSKSFKMNDKEDDIISCIEINNGLGGAA